MVAVPIYLNPAEIVASGIGIVGGGLKYPQSVRIAVYQPIPVPIASANRPHAVGILGG